MPWDTRSALPATQQDSDSVFGTEPERRPIAVMNEVARNPAFTTFWLPWARVAQKGFNTVSVKPKHPLANL